MANNGSENTHKLHRGKENCTEGDQSDCLHLTKQRKKITFRQRFCLRKNGDLSMVSAVVSINQRKIKRNLSIHFAILCCWWCNGRNNASLLKGHRFKSRWTKMRPTLAVNLKVLRGSSVASRTAALGAASLISRWEDAGVVHPPVVIAGQASRT